MEYLNSVSTEQLLAWRDVLEEYSAAFGALHLVSDTETTGTRVFDVDNGNYHRVIEWSVSFNYKDQHGLLQPILDQSGNRISLCEAINPWTEAVTNQRQAATIQEIPRDGVDVHGITMEYLFGQSEGHFRKKLARPAPSFNVVFDAIETLLNFGAYFSAKTPVYIYFYNIKFDVGFLNSEMEMFSKPPLESYFIPIDPMSWMQTLLKGLGFKKYSLDVAHEWAIKNYPEVTRGIEINRTIHSASVDTLMLERVISAYLMHLKKNK